MEVNRRGFLGSAAAAGTAGLASSCASQGATQAASTATPTHSVRMTVNGRETRAEVESRVSLLDWLRERAQLTGTKKGCNEGACGACTVMVNGERQNSCLVTVAQLDGAEITTIEGIADGDALHAVQQAFIEHDAFQCGFCTPGQVVSAVACIEEGHATDEASVREWMSGNLCRCAAYPQITAAVLDAAGRVRRG